MFLSQLARQLDELGAEGVRAAVEAHARSLRPSERAAFLGVFAVGATNAIAGGLLEEIDRLAAELTDLPPRWDRGYRHWDDDDDDDAYEIESSELDDLFVAAGERFLAGDVALAAAAYERLLDSVVGAVDDERGISLRPDAELVEEAFTRVLWCRMRSAPTRVVDAVESYRILTSVPSLSTVLAAHPDLGPPGDDMLRIAADGLLGADPTEASWEARARLGLGLALRAHVDGFDSVIAFARLPGPLRLDVATWAVRQLVDDGSLAVAADLAHDTIDAMGDSQAVAELADIAAALDVQLGRPALDAATRAWSASPTITRLEVALEAATPNEREQFVTEAAAHSFNDRFLATATSILAGDVHAAAARALDASSWDHSRRAIQLAVAACCAVASPVRIPRIETAIASACVVADHRRPWATTSTAPVRHTPTPLADRLRTALTTIETDSTYLAAARGLVHDTVEAILEAKERSQYAVAARLIVVVAATREAVEGVAAGELIDEFDQRYRRFSAFRKELRAARAP